MQTGTLWLIIFITGLGTFLMRVSLIELYGKIKMHPLLEKSLRFIPSAIFAALMVPALVYNNEIIDLSFTNYRLMAGIIAAIIAWKAKNVLLTTLVGIGALWILQWGF